MPPSIIPAKAPRRRKRRPVVNAPPGVPPVLIEASFDAETLLLTLGFDIAVDLVGIVPAAIGVADRPRGFIYAGAAVAEVLSPSSFTLAMEIVGEGIGAEVLLEAGAGTGIVAAVGGVVWAGTGGQVELPIPTPPPPVPAVVVSVWSDGGSQCTITFDKPIDLLGPPDDGSIYVASMGPIAASLDDPQTLRLTISGGVGAGAPWNIYAQPGWISTPIAFPQEGVFPEGSTTKSTKGTKKKRGTSQKSKVRARTR